MKQAIASVVLLLGLACTSSFAVEGAPTPIQYQGTALDEAGSPLAPTTPTNYTVEFRLWSALTGGTLIWSESQLVTISKGLFSVRLGEGTAIGAEPNDLSTAFEAKDRFLGLTIKTTSTATETVPRLAFLAAPYAFVANTSTSVSQKPGTFSNMRVTSVGYQTRRAEAGEVLVALTTDTRTNLIAAGPRGTVAQLPIAGGQQELLIAKTDATDKVVAVAPPLGGTINGSSAMLRLKAQGESITVQNIGGNDWWIVKDTRDNTPVGTIISYGATAPPPGYLACDGASLLRDDHPDLFAVVGPSWGASAETNTQALDPNRFNLPNLSGRFLRGVDPANNGADNDAGGRGLLYAGGNAGRRVGSYQKDEFIAHAHSITSSGHTHAASLASSDKIQVGTQSESPHLTEPGDKSRVTFSDYPGPEGVRGSSSPSFSVSPPTVTNSTTGITQTEDAGGSETRPDNAGVRYCIKY